MYVGVRMSQTTTNRHYVAKDSQMKLKKIGGRDDILDLAFEAGVHNMVEISIDKFKQALVDEKVDGKRVIKALESQNFGYLVTEDKSVYRC